MGMDYDTSADPTGMGKVVAQEFSDRHDCGFTGQSGRFRCGEED